MVELNIIDEVSELEAVIVGTASSFGGTPKAEDAYDPKSLQHIINGTYPDEDSLTRELDHLASELLKRGIQVFRPNIIPSYNQIFSRDKGFVIEDTFIISNIIDQRKREIEGITTLMETFENSKIIRPEKKVRIEGGDVMPWNDHIFIGYSKKPDFEKYTVARTNEEGIDFIRELFPHKTIKAFELIKSDENPLENALHLDCCFQPIGEKWALICPAGFKNQQDVDYIVEYFGKENLIKVSQQEMYDMFCNIFSISPDTVVTEKGFTRLNEELRQRGFNLVEIDFSQTSKLGGLLRCSTLPLRRKLNGKNF